MEAWSKRLGLNEDAVEDLRLLAFTYIKQGHYKTALTLYKGIVILSQYRTEDLQTLGALYLQADEYEKALETLEKALAKDPRHLKSQLNHAKALLLVGKLDRAFLELHRLKEVNDPDIVSDAEALLLAYGPS